MAPVEKDNNTDNVEDAKFQNKLETLECPFTWDMDDITNEPILSTDYKPHDEEDEIPLLQLMRIVMQVFVETKSFEKSAKKEEKSAKEDENSAEEGENSKSILENLKKCDELLIKIKDKANSNISTDAVRYVLEGTKCHVYWRLREKSLAEEIYKEIKFLSSTDKIGRSTLNACKSIGWSKYHWLGSGEAVEFIQKAMEDNPNCDIFHFILGKNLRRIRRDASVGSIPEKEEADAFLKAYEISKNEVYGIFVAQMYREQRMNHKAVRMYEEIYRSRPKSYTVYLRLALGFMQLNKPKLAKMCLDQVALKYPDDSTYMHYTGKYYMKIKNFREALHYLEKAASQNNYPAGKDFLRCKLKVDSTFNTTEYLLKMVEKFKDLPEKQIQPLIFEVAYSYVRKGQIEKSLKHFLDCIEIDPNSLALTEFYSIFKPGESVNVYTVLAREVFPKFAHNRDHLDESTLESLDELKNCYDQYLESRLYAVQTGISKMKTK